ncbi:hypothetical protein GNP92_22935 [Paenibacillus timonensis]|nr:hypothetical protein [Paenibacillus timonensis]MUG89179.1 hypothetical protein [Paenibacillus timonensis]
MWKFAPSGLNKNIRLLLEIVLCVVVCLLGMWYVLRLQYLDLSVPYVYRGDGLSTSLFIKGMIENGWYNVNPSLGAPFGLEMYDYPLGGDNFQYLIMKVLSLINADYVWVMNVYYLLTFPLCMISAYIVLKHFKVNIPLALAFSLLYTFVPYHIIRTGHLFLLGYYMVPLIVMVILWVAHKEDFLLVKRDSNSGLKYKINWNMELVASFIICILIGSTGAYYAFFACFFLLVMGAVRYIQEKKALYIIKSIFLIFIVAVTLVLNISPSILYKISNSDGQSTSARNFEASEVYGLKIAQLLLPTTGHNIDWISDKKDEYNAKAPLVNENDTASLGFVGAIGFMYLLFVLFKNTQYKSNIDRYNKSLSLLNISAILLGTIGGFSVLFAALISAQIRSYNRLSIFIAFFACLALAMNIDGILNKMKKNFKYIVSVILCLFIAILGMYDQSTHPLAPSEVTAIDYNNDVKFVQQINKLMPSKSMIFQVPYVSFPEGEHLNNMGNYDLLKGYLHSSDLLWSFGNMKNGFGDKWMKELVKLPIDKAINIISYSGYTGIYIDRTGYTTDYANELEVKLQGIINVKPIESENKMLAFYDLRDYVDDLKNEGTEEEWEAYKQQYLSNINYDTEISLSESEWEFVQSKTGYKIVQTSNLENLPEDQLNISVTNSEGNSLVFNDGFSDPNQYSNRHWEQPSHFVISIPNTLSGWEEDYLPTINEINEFFNKNKYLLKFTSSQNQLSFAEQVRK